MHIIPCFINFFFYIWLEPLDLLHIQNASFSFILPRQFFELYIVGKGLPGDVLFRIGESVC